MSNPIQNFYKSTITQDWSIGPGNFYVSVKPSTTVGRLVVSPSSDTLREIIEYTNTGTDANGDYIVVSVRGVGDTVEQTHTVGEKVRMNITAEDWEDIRDDIDSIVAAGAPNISTTQKGIGELATAAQIDALTENGETGAPVLINPKLLGDAHNIPHAAPGTLGNVLVSNGTDWVSISNIATSGIATYDLTTVSGVQTIAHGLGRIPKKVKLNGAVVIDSENTYHTIGSFTSSGNASMAIGFREGGSNESTDYLWSSTTYGIAFSNDGADNPYGTYKTQKGIITVDATNITITWTKTNSPTGTATILWEAE